MPAVQCLASRQSGNRLGSHDSIGIAEVTSAAFEIGLESGSLMRLCEHLSTDETYALREKNGLERTGADAIFITQSAKIDGEWYALIAKEGGFEVGPKLSRLYMQMDPGLVEQRLAAFERALHSNQTQPQINSAEQFSSNRTYLEVPERIVVKGVEMVRVYHMEIPLLNNGESARTQVDDFVTRVFGREAINPKAPSGYDVQPLEAEPGGTLKFLHRAVVEHLTERDPRVAREYLQRSEHICRDPDLHQQLLQREIQQRALQLYNKLSPIADPTSLYEAVQAEVVSRLRAEGIHFRLATAAQEQQIRSLSQQFSFKVSEFSSELRHTHLKSNVPDADLRPHSSDTLARALPDHSPFSFRVNFTATQPSFVSESTSFSSVRAVHTNSVSDQIELLSKPALVRMVATSAHTPISAESPSPVTSEGSLRRSASLPPEKLENLSGLRTERFRGPRPDGRPLTADQLISKRRLPAFKGEKHQLIVHREARRARSQALEGNELVLDRPRSTFTPRNRQAPKPHESIDVRFRLRSAQTEASRYKATLKEFSSPQRNMYVDGISVRGNRLNGELPPPEAIRLRDSRVSRFNPVLHREGASIKEPRSGLNQANAREYRRILAATSRHAPASRVQGRAIELRVRSLHATQGTSSKIASMRANPSYRIIIERMNTLGTRARAVRARFNALLSRVTMYSNRLFQRAQALSPLNHRIPRLSPALIFARRRIESVRHNSALRTLVTRTTRLMSRLSRYFERMVGFHSTIKRTDDRVRAPRSARANRPVPHAELLKRSTSELQTLGIRAARALRVQVRRLLDSMAEGRRALRASSSQLSHLNLYARRLERVALRLWQRSANDSERLRLRHLVLALRAVRPRDGVLDRSTLLFVKELLEEFLARPDRKARQDERRSRKVGATGSTGMGKGMPELSEVRLEDLTTEDMREQVSAADRASAEALLQITNVNGMSATEEKPQAEPLLSADNESPAYELSIVRMKAEDSSTQNSQMLSSHS